ncbi:hypothetical protein D9758_005491 [Tetrapyrgos nigripes]|uniref:Uncharacterized protein n=1 Tax=Tetrapyrgos nigripes TaxID=182062 RepID=A0A8H5GIH7_9AGAR|nr:hypothetical protein D9758_005491 [Tetrapyrgos nigripes]
MGNAELLQSLYAQDPKGGYWYKIWTGMRGIGKELVFSSLMAGSIIVHNASNQDIQVFVSKYSNSNGGDSWFALKAGQSDSWSRNNWEVVAFKKNDDSERAGVYTATNKMITFRSFGDIQVHD